MARPRLDRRAFIGGALGACSAGLPRRQQTPRRDRAVMIGSANALAGMQRHYADLAAGGDALDAVIAVVKVQEADPEDTSVGLGGLPNEDGVVQLDAACMHGPTHKSGAVAALENILHPSEVARLVMERTDHCLLVGRGAYEFARAHGHAHVELLTEHSRQKWIEWRETMSEHDDRLPPAEPRGAGHGGRAGAHGRTAYAEGFERHWGTVHCSALSVRRELACTTSTSGLAWKIPGRVGDSPIVGAGLYCDQEAGSAGATGRGEAAILANGSAMIVELMRQGATPLDAGLEVLRRVARQTERQAAWQPALIGPDGNPSFGLNFYVLGLDGSSAGVTLKGQGQYARCDPEGGPRLEELVAALG
jgi:N4-(beta-N-acetylglucosaminyl)-L-asparaginase